ncbi:hypothetical protein ACJX0J_016847, partial [Zea mays]
ADWKTEYIVETFQSLANEIRLKFFILLVKSDYCLSGIFVVSLFGGRNNEDVHTYVASCDCLLFSTSLTKGGKEKTKRDDHVEAAAQYKYISISIYHSITQCFLCDMYTNIFQVFFNALTLQTHILLRHVLLHVPEYLV